MSTVHVFDPAMCCSTGVCGPSVDDALVRFAADLDWLKSQGVAVERYNLSQQPAAFVADAAAKSTLEARGEEGLPLVKVNGEVKSSGVYPSRSELAAWAGVAAPAPSIYSEAVAELVALGAAVASGCEPCFKAHYDKARKLGVSREDMQRAVASAQAVKGASAKMMGELAERYLRAPAPAVAATATQLVGIGIGAKDKAAAACCPPEESGASTAKKSGGCCGMGETCPRS